MNSHSLSESHENHLRPPTVPTPDWSIENYALKNSTKINSDEKPIQGCSTGEHSKKEEMDEPSTIKTNHETDGNQTPQRPNSHSLIGNSSSHSVLSRITGDESLTPTNLLTPLFSRVINPHNTMAAMTPAASGSDQAKNSIKLQNCVSTVSLGCELKLLEIYCRTRYSEYNPARFQGVVMKILDPRATALVFRSGKIVCTGARNEHDSYLAARKFARIVHKLGYPVRFLDFKIQNFCATADLRFPIRLESLQQTHGQFASYEPELFPGLVYRMVRPRVVLLIFVNGKIVFTGESCLCNKYIKWAPENNFVGFGCGNRLGVAKYGTNSGRSRNEISEALDIIYPILRSFRIS